MIIYKLSLVHCLLVTIHVIHSAFSFGRLKRRRRSKQIIFVWKRDLPFLKGGPVLESWHKWLIGRRSEAPGRRLLAIQVSRVNTNDSSGQRPTDRNVKNQLPNQSQRLKQLHFLSFGFQYFSFQFTCIWRGVKIWLWGDPTSMQTKVLCPLVKKTFYSL